jgi:PKD repeat protein
MKKIIIGSFVLFSCLITGDVFSQQITVADTVYENLKRNNQLQAGANYKVVATKKIQQKIQPKSTERAGNCACYTPHDGSYTLAMTPNDDGSTGLIPIPFNFCLYGTNYNALYINNNGNVTFDVAYGTYSAVGFPSASYVMVAPFWADVDTRGIGQVWYKVTPTAVYVNWENCGYFDSYTDKTNTFSLIITDGNDPVVGAGNNVAFCYQDMQWTTGDASSGVNGFGGVAATVGCNKGDGVDFVQFGRFDSPGSAYFGPYATNNGISWLDNQSFIFNACNATNIAPVLANGFGQCDTIRLCQGDTLLQTINVLSPEAGQITVVTGSSTSPDFTVIDTTSGNQADITVQVIGNTPGIFTATINAIDNGVPVQNVNITLVFEITPNNTPDPTITGDTLLCPGNVAILSVDSIYDTYTWSNGSTVDSTTASTSGIYYVTVSLNGCKQRDSITVVATPSPTLNVPIPPTCDNVPFTFSATSNDTIVSYNWTFTGGTPGSSTTANPVVVYPAAGSYPMSLTIANEVGCTTTVNQNVLVTSGPNPHLGIYPLCISRFTFDPFGIGDSAWVIDYYMGDGTVFLDRDTTIFNYIYSSPGTYNVSMVVTDPSGCTDSITEPVVVLDTLSLVMPNVLVHSSTMGNDRFDMEVIKPKFNLCVEYTLTVFDRWGVKVYEAYNDPYNPDLYCNDCFKGKTEGGNLLSPGVYHYVLKGAYQLENHGFITIFD